MNDVFYITVFTAIGLLIANAQQEQILPQKEITIIKSYQPEVKESFKINLHPNFHDSIPVKQEVQYQIQDVQAKTRFSYQPIQATKLRSLKKNNTERLLIKAGIGNYTTPYAELFYGSSSLKNGNYNIRAKHLSSTGGIPNVGFNGYSENLIGVNGKKIFDKSELYGEVSYNRNTIYYYGYNATDTTVDKLNIKQTFQLIEGNINYKSIHDKKDVLKYDVKLGSYYLTDRFNSIESNSVLAVGIGKSFQKELFWANFTLDHNWLSNNQDSITNIIFSVNPKVISKTDRYEVSIGITGTVSEDTTGFYRLYPDVNFRYKLLEGKLVPYITLNGQLKRNNYKSFSDENPFISNTPHIMNTNYKYHFEFGSNGVFFPYISYNVNLSHSYIENLPFFVTDTTYSFNNRFNLVYDTVRLLMLHAEVSFKKNEELKVFLAGNYYNYSQVNLMYPWHKPGFDVKLSAFYQVINSLNLYSEVFILGNMYVYDYKADSETKLNNIYDINIGAEYSYNKNITAFANINNILSQNYMRWYNYPSQGINAMIGLTYSFK